MYLPISKWSFVVCYLSIELVKQKDMTHEKKERGHPGPGFLLHMTSIIYIYRAGLQRRFIARPDVSHLRNSSAERRFHDIENDHDYNNPRGSDSNRRQA